MAVNVREKNQPSLTPKQRRAIEALAVLGKSFESAAEYAGVSGRTLSRWRTQTAFVDALRLADDENFAELARLAGAASRTAFLVLIKLMENDNPSIRARAASAILDHRHKLYETLNLAERLAELEKRLDDAQNLIRSNGNGYH